MVRLIFCAKNHENSLLDLTAIGLGLVLPPSALLVEIDHIR